MIEVLGPCFGDCGRHVGVVPVAAPPPSRGRNAVFRRATLARRSAMVFVLLTYGGWNEGAYLSAEVRGGPRAIVRTLVIAILLITAVLRRFRARTLVVGSAFWNA